MEDFMRDALVQSDARQESLLQGCLVEDIESALRVDENVDSCWGLWTLGDANVKSDCTITGRE